MESTYIFLQHYWWFIISLLGALLVFLLFVQGGNSLLFHLGKNETERALLVNATGSKWEFTFTTLVTFGGAFFASFPLFYSHFTYLQIPKSRGSTNPKVKYLSISEATYDQSAFLPAFHRQNPVPDTASHPPQHTLLSSDNPATANKAQP